MDNSTLIALNTSLILWIKIFHLIMNHHFYFSLLTMCLIKKGAGVKAFEDALKISEMMGSPPLLHFEENINNLMKKIMKPRLISISKIAEVVARPTFCLPLKNWQINILKLISEIWISRFFWSIKWTTLTLTVFWIVMWRLPSVAIIAALSCFTIVRKVPVGTHPLLKR